MASLFDPAKNAQATTRIDLNNTCNGHILDDMDCILILLGLVQQFAGAFLTNACEMIVHYLNMIMCMTIQM